MERLLRPAEVGEIIGRPVATLAWWRCRGQGPSFIKIGGRVVYRADDIEAWLSQLRRPTRRPRRRLGAAGRRALAELAETTEQVEAGYENVLDARIYEEQ